MATVESSPLHHHLRDMKKENIERYVKEFEKECKYLSLHLGYANSGVQKIDRLKSFLRTTLEAVAKEEREKIIELVEGMRGYEAFSEGDVPNILISRTDLLQQLQGSSQEKV